MNALERNAALLIAGTVLVCTVNVASRQIEGCRAPEDRCLPVRYCRLYSNSTLAKVQVTEQQLSERQCNPEERIDETTHVCCPKASIRCRWDDGPAACLQTKHCPTYQTANVDVLMRANATSLCYVHNNTRFFCCPELFCGLHHGLCDSEPARWNRTPSVFPRCGIAGSLVPRELCPLNASGSSSNASTVCCTASSPTPRLIAHPKAAVLANVSCGVMGDVYKELIYPETQPGQFPWMVLIRYRTQLDTNICAGTLVHPRYVLTAARCIHERLNPPVKVRVGAYDVLKHPRACDDPTVPKCPARVKEYPIAQLFIHETHDIGLVKLTVPVDLAAVQSAGLICLPIYDTLRVHLPANLIVTGWGMIANERDISSRMLSGTAQVLPQHAGCEIGRTFCSRDINRANHCPGGPGGPYQATDEFNGSVRVVQYAVIAAGSNECTAGSGGGVSRGTLVSYFLHWILDNMEL